jgi:isopenicillin N synthase-like dioxygenase
MSEARTIPVIDFSRWIKGSYDAKKQVAREIADACRHVGFVYIVNHRVKHDLLDEAFAWSKKLFDLPVEKKMLAPHPPGMLVEQIPQIQINNNGDFDEKVPTFTEAIRGPGLKRSPSTSIKTGKTLTPRKRNFGKSRIAR